MLLGTLPAITFCWWFGTLGTFSIPVHWSNIRNNSYFLEHVFTFYRLKSQKTICMYVPCYSIKQYVWLQFIMRFILKWNFLFLLSNAGGHGHNTVVVSFSCWGVKKSELVLSKFAFGLVIISRTLANWSCCDESKKKFTVTLLLWY